MDGESSPGGNGAPPRFVLKRLGPGVWKVGPSIVSPGLLHAHVTIVDVPEPAPWLVEGG
jgi:hypothetical protein